MFELYENCDFEKTALAPVPSLSPVRMSKTEFYINKDYYICFILDGKRIEIFIPAFFIMDGASIPRFFWRIAGHPMNPMFVIAALVHDALFGKINGRVKIWSNGELLTSLYAQNFFDRKRTDRLFKYLLDAEGNSGFKVATMYRAVRLGGWASFRKQNNKFMEI